MQRVAFPQYLDKVFVGMSPGQAAVSGAIGILIFQAALQTLAPGRVARRLYLAFWRFVRRIAAPIIRKEIKKTTDGLSFVFDPSFPIYETLPRPAVDSAKVVDLAKNLHQKLDTKYETGALSGTVYHGGAEHTELVNRVMEVYQWTNPLHTDTFNALRKMESEVIQMVVDMWSGTDECCGSITTGGTESIIMAMLAYREEGRARGIEYPTIVMPVTGHPAFDKASHYFGMRLIKVPVDPARGCVDAAELERYISADTVVIVGSSPNFPNGTIDPIAELSEVALRRNVGLHVDGCLGSFLVPHLRDAGVLDAPIVDFRLPGVTTISCDTHKFGFAPKGTSTVLYRTAALRARQFFATAEWPGGLYGSPTISGSRPGNVVAGTWAAMLSVGKQGYIDAARAVHTTMMKIRKAIDETKEIHVIGNPTVCAIAFASRTLDIYTVEAELHKKGWRLAALQFPSGIQFSLTLIHTRGDIADRFIADLKSSVATVEAERVRMLKEEGQVMPVEGGASLYGTQQQVPDRSIIEDVTRAYFTQFYDTRAGEEKARKKLEDETAQK